MNRNNKLILIGISLLVLIFGILMVVLLVQNKKEKISVAEKKCIENNEVKENKQRGIGNNNHNGKEDYIIEMNNKNNTTLQSIVKKTTTNFGSFLTRTVNNRNKPFIGNYKVEHRQQNDQLFLIYPGLDKEKVDEISFSYTDRKVCCFPDKFTDFLDNFKKEEKIGSGFLGEVFKIVKKSGCNHKYALKIKDRVKGGCFPHGQTFYDNELYFLKFFQLNKNDYVCEGFAGYFEKDVVYLVQELLETTLESKIRKKELSDSELQNYIKDLFLAIVSLHKQRIVHGDIKLDNIGISYDKKLKLIDFGCSIKKDSGYSMTAGFKPVYFRPPEALDPLSPHELNYDADWWAFGVTLYNIYENAFPYPVSENLVIGITDKWEMLKIMIMGNMMRPFKNPNISEDLKNLIKQLLSSNPSRLGAKKSDELRIARHPYFSKYGLEKHEVFIY
ncbi:serine/threonine-protein kinase [Spraguea lophii 42_110]|uniref:Serine/threonine-protein kinase n=1 Tax=Spraguea lophii (strain 42_110) TaxID=1358809 RepID=S7XQR1_SPRLO|nr:serine/threonine-protein kinase [Spraguea lophii 42_110]